MSTSETFFIHEHTKLGQGVLHGACWIGILSHCLYKRTLKYYVLARMILDAFTEEASWRVTRKGICRSYVCLKKSKKNLLSLGYRYKYLCVQIPVVRCTSKNWDGKSFGESEHGDLALKKRCYVNPSTSNLSREDRRTSLISGRIAFVLLVRTFINSYFENKLLRVLNLFWSFNLAPSEK